MASKAKALPFLSIEMLASLGVCVFYGGVSLLLGLLNKSLLSSYDFQCIFILLSAQMLLQVVLCTVSRDYLKNPAGIPHYDKAVHYEALILGFAYVANVAVGLLGLSLVNVPMFFCIRRLVSPTILLYEYLWLSKVAEANIQAAVGTIMVGTIIAGWDTLSADVVGYSITFLNNLCTAASSVSQKSFCDKTKLGAVGTLYYTSLTALPLSLLMALVFGEFETLLAFKHLHDGGFWFGFAVALSLGPLLTYSSILCTTYNSPLAMSITGNIKDLASTILGALLFKGFTATVKSVGGLALTFVGAGIYSYINLKKGQAKASSAAGEVADKAAAAASAGAAEGGGAGASGAGSASAPLDAEKGTLIASAHESDVTLKRGNKSVS
jgi:solute carrier family 35 protein